MLAIASSAFLYKNNARLLTDFEILYISIQNIKNNKNR